MLAAVGAGAVDRVEALLAEGVSPDAESATAQPPLFLAVERGHLACAEALLDAKASVHPTHLYEKFMMWTTPLMRACMHGDDQAVALLMAHSASREAGELVVMPEQEEECNFGRTTALMLACIFAHPACVSHLLRCGFPTYDVVTQCRNRLIVGDCALRLALRKSTGGLPHLRAFERRSPKESQAKARECALLILAKRRADHPTAFSASHLAHVAWACVPDVGATEARFDQPKSRARAARLRTLLEARVDVNTRRADICATLAACDGGEGIAALLAAGRYARGRSEPRDRFTRGHSRTSWLWHTRELAPLDCGTRGSSRARLDCGICWRSNTGPADVPRRPPDADEPFAPFRVPTAGGSRPQVRTPLPWSSHAAGRRIRW